MKRRKSGALMCALALVGASALAAVGLVGGSSPARAATVSSPTPYLSVTVNPIHNLSDGEPMTVSVTRTQAGTAAHVEVNIVGTGWCASGTKPWHVPKGQLSITNNALPASDVEGNRCTTSTEPLNNDPRSISALVPTTSSTGNYPSVTGTIPAQTSTGTTLHNGTGKLKCNGTNPCTLYVAAGVSVLGKPTSPTAGIYVFTVHVTFLPTSVKSSCGGEAATPLTIDGPDRLSHLLTNWTVDGCEGKLAGGKAVGVPVTSSETDRQVLCQFASGRADLVFSAVGYGTSSSPFNPARCVTTSHVGSAQPDRPYVAVPVALNAVVLAHTQTLLRTNIHFTSFRSYPTQLDITASQLGQLMGAAGYGQSWTGALGSALLNNDEDPLLSRDYFYVPTNTATEYPVGYFNHSTGAKGVVTTSGNQATTYFLTQYLHTVLPAATLVSITKGHPPLTVLSTFGTSVAPKYDVTPISGLVNIVHVLTPGVAGSGMPWALLASSSATAIWFGMTSVALQASDSIGAGTPVYVKPSTTTMQAAVANMIPQPDTTLLPNPKGGAVNAVEPYPLTYVEYAIAPTQPLLGANCTLKVQSEQNLIGWLDYITGAGQTELPKGMTALTPVLQGQARAAIAKVGTAAPGCSAPTSPTIATNEASAGSSAALGGTTAAGGFGATGALQSALGSNAGSPGSKGGAAAKGASGGTSHSTHSSDAEIAAALQGFRAAGGDWELPAGGVLLLFLFLPGLVLVMSGRPTRELLAGVGRWLGRARSWLPGRSS